MFSVYFSSANMVRGLVSSFFCAFVLAAKVQPIPVYSVHHMFSVYFSSANMVRGLLSFLVGVYAGIYLSQNYDIPKVDDPGALYEKIKEFADKHRKS